MSQRQYLTTPLGELISAAFESASLLSPDPKEVSRMAAQVIAVLLGSALRVSISRLPQGAHGQLKAQPAGVG